MALKVIDRAKDTGGIDGLMKHPSAFLENLMSGSNVSQNFKIRKLEGLCIAGWHANHKNMGTCCTKKKLDVERKRVCVVCHVLSYLQGLEGCLVIGHTSTDLDSIAGAIGAADLYRGTALRAEADVCHCCHTPH